MSMFYSYICLIIELTGPSQLGPLSCFLAFHHVTKSSSTIFFLKYRLLPWGPWERGRQRKKEASSHSPPLQPKTNCSFFQQGWQWGSPLPYCSLEAQGHLSSVQFSHSVVSDSLRSHKSQHTRPPCPSPTPGVHSDSCPSSQWCHRAISSSVVPFSSCPQSLPASESFLSDC